LRSKVPFEIKNYTTFTITRVGQFLTFKKINKIKPSIPVLKKLITSIPIPILVYRKNETWNPVLGLVLPNKMKNPNSSIGLGSKNQTLDCRKPDQTQWLTVS
jgi:hypothetical protein